MIPPLHRCWAEIDLQALRENLAWLRHRVGPAAKILTVVKADAYGHGLRPIAGLLMQSGADFFGVANLAEAHAIRSVGPGWPILLLSACLPHEIEAALRDEVRPTLSSIGEARAFSAAASHQRRTVWVHLKVDTGMGRLGARPADAASLVRAVTRLPGLKLEGLYTHFASAEDDPIQTKKQIHSFHKVQAAIAKLGVEIPLIHASNSAALLHETEIVGNLVRPGLLVYGILPAGKRRVKTPLPLRPALNWKCRVSFVKMVARGTPLSYGATFVAPRSLRVATLSVGYGDGYLRAGSNRAEVLLQGKRCRVLGRITMDQMLVDASALARVRVGDEAVLIGRQGRDEIGAGEVADWCGTIPWEVLTKIGHRVPRVYLGGHSA